MLSYLPASPEQINEFIQLLRSEARDYIDHVSQLMQLTPDQFAQLVRTVGQVYSIYQDDTLTGFYWIEERGKILHLHGLAIFNAYQGRGLGTQVLQMLADTYTGTLDAIELGVQDSNVRARTLYEKLGYKTIRRLEELGFSVMQRALISE